MNDEEEERKRIRLIGMYMTIPFVLGVPPVIGWLIGHWLDSKFGTDPILMFIFIILGFTAGIREFYRIIKRFGNDT